MSSSCSSRNSLLELTRRISNFHFENATQLYLPFICESQRVGLVAPEVAEQLKKYPDVLTVSKEGVVLSPGLDDPHKRNHGMEKILLDMRDKKIFPTLSGWRNEKYEVKTTFSSKALFEMERSATPLFGIRMYGCHINGYVNHSSLGLCLWTQKRSMTKPTWPGMNDNFVGGGLSAGMGVRETAIKEAGEEANVPEHLAVQMKQVGSVSFLHRNERGLNPQTEFVFDLELPETFSPGNNDGEVESFKLVPVAEVRSLICSDQYKTTSCAIALDWLIRNGIVTPETDPDFPAIVENIHLPVHQLYNSRNNV